METLVSHTLSRFYSGKRVLVTGHTGFKGAWLARWLQLLGAQVSGLALAPAYQPNLFELAKLDEELDSRVGDVRNLDFVQRVVSEVNPEVVFHLAAQPLVRRSYREPLETFSTNVMGTASLLEACRHVDSVRSIVVVTSDKCYENREWVWGYREHEPMGGADPYSASKGCTELVTAAYRRSFFSTGGGAALASARAGNVIGGGDWSEDRLVPDMIRGITADKDILIRNPASTRPWQHVLEPLAGYLQLAQQLHGDPARYADGWNFGPAEDDTMPVRILAELFIATIGRGRLVLGPPDPQALHEAKLLALDCSKARHLLGWKPRLDANACVRLTADWYSAHLNDPGSERSVLDAQIRNYQALLT